MYKRRQMVIRLCGPILGRNNYVAFVENEQVGAVRAELPTR